MSPTLSKDIISSQRSEATVGVPVRWRTGQLALIALIGLLASYYALVGWHSPAGDSGSKDNFSPFDLAGFALLGVLVWLTTPTAWTVAITTFNEAVRRKWFLVLLGFALVLMGVSVLFTWMQPGEEQKFMRDFGVGFTVIMTLLVAIFLGVALIPPEIERRTIFTILSKPVDRLEFLIGKYIGLCMVLFLNLALMALMFLAAYAWFVMRREGGFAAAMAQDNEGISKMGLMFDLGNLARAFLLHSGNLAIMGAVALTLSQILSNMTAIIFSFIIYFAGQSASYWEYLANPNRTGAISLSPAARGVVDVLYAFLPRLDRFEARERLINDLPIGLNYMLKAGSSSVVYVAALLAVSYYFFSDREF